MADLNKVQLLGNLTRDPEMRTTPKGTAVTELGLAINSSYRLQDGTSKEEVCYVSVEAWGRQAETCKQYLTKGSQVLVEGSLKYESWETREGEKRNTLRVRADRVQFLNTRGGGAGGEAPRSGGGEYRGGGGESRGGGSESRGGGGQERYSGGGGRSEGGSRSGGGGYERERAPERTEPPRPESGPPPSDDDIPF